MSIPKIIHFIWLGGERPKKFNSLVEKIKHINYDYEIIEWNDSNINFELVNQKIFDSTENMGAKSDILRFEILFKYGGIYMDYDFLQIKKFDDLLDYDFFAGTHHEAKTEVWNSIIGSVEKNEVCLTFLENIKKITTPIKRDEIDRVMQETGPYLLEKIIKNDSFNCKVKILIGDYFYPFPAVQRNFVKEITEENIKYLETFKKNETYCIHIHTTSWQ